MGFIACLLRELHKFGCDSISASSCSTEAFWVLRNDVKMSIWGEKDDFQSKGGRRWVALLLCTCCLESVGMAEGLQTAPERSLLEELSLQKWEDLAFFPPLAPGDVKGTLLQILYVAHACEKS